MQIIAKKEKKKKQKENLHPSKSTEAYGLEAGLPAPQVGAGDPLPHYIFHCPKGAAR